MAACELTSTALMVFCVVWFNSVWWFLCQKCCLSPGSTKQILARVCKLINVSAPKAPSAALFGDRKSSVKKYGCPVLRDRVFLIVHLLVDYCKTLVPFGLLNLSWKIILLPTPTPTNAAPCNVLSDGLLIARENCKRCWTGDARRTLKVQARQRLLLWYVSFK